MTPKNLPPKAAPRSLFHLAIRRWRRDGMTIEEVAAALDASVGNVHTWLGDNRITPQPRFRRRMAEYLDAQNGGKK